MELVEIYLDGDRAVVLKEMRHKTSRAISAVLTKHNKTRQELIEQIKNGIPDASILDENNEVILLNQVVEWSFGPVTQDILDNISVDKYQKLVAEVDKLYSQVPLPISSLPQTPS